MDQHDDIAHPHEHDPKRRAPALPTRAERQVARPRLTLVREEGGHVDDGDNDAQDDNHTANEPLASAQRPVQQQQQQRGEIYLRAAEMVEQAHAAYLKGTFFRHDALRDWATLLLLRVCTIVVLALRGAHILLYVDILLVFFYDIPVLLAAVPMMQLLIFYSTAASAVHVGWSLYELIKWYTTYLFATHHRHYNGGIVVGWIGFGVLLCMLLVVIMQTRNLVNLSDANLLHYEIMTTIGDIGRSAKHDPAFRRYATGAGQALVRAGTDDEASSPALSAPSPIHQQQQQQQQRTGFLANVPILGKLLFSRLSTTTANPLSPSTAPPAVSFGVDHVKTS